MEETVFDVFLSYNHNDRKIAEYIAAILEQQEFKVWFDQKELINESQWVEWITKGIIKSKSLIILIGNTKLTKWQIEELCQFEANHIKKDYPIIPVILPGARTSKLPPMLVSKQCIDCRNHISERSIYEIILHINRSKTLPQISKVSEEFNLVLEGNQKTNVKIYPLRNIEKNKVLNISWETFGFGMERIVNQINDFPYHLDIDAFIGLDDAGLVMTTILNSSKGTRSKIGYVQMSRKTNQISCGAASFFPELKPNPTILVTDIELRTGKSLEAGFNEILRKYDNPTIYFASLAALTKDSTCVISKFDDLVAYTCISNLKIEAFFIAYTVFASGIELPLHLS
jgi:hypothetical protein